MKLVLMFLVAVVAGCLGTEHVEGLKRIFQKKCEYSGYQFKDANRCQGDYEAESYFYHKATNKCHLIKHKVCPGDPKPFTNLEYCLVACTGKKGSTAEYSKEAKKHSVHHE